MKTRSRIVWRQDHNVVVLTRGLERFELTPDEWLELEAVRYAVEEASGDPRAPDRAVFAPRDQPRLDRRD